MAEVAIVGAGPAGISAASVLLDHGVVPILFDEADGPGGQVYRRPAKGLDIDIRRLLGPEYSAYETFHKFADEVCNAADLHRRCTVYGIHGGELWAVRADASTLNLSYSALILATGAIDRIFPVKGWTLPGVYALGGTQALLKQQGCLIGRTVVFCGSSPLLYLAALQYLRMGGSVSAVLDTTPFRAKLGASPLLAFSPRTLLRGVGYMRQLRAAGVQIRHGVELLEFVESDGEVSGVRFRNGAGLEETIACDAVATGYGIRPESQLADLAACGFRFDATFGQWLPTVDSDGRGAEGVYLAGDATRIGGADAAKLSGTLAGIAVLADMGVAVKGMNTGALRRKLARLHSFQRGLACAFGPPVLNSLADDVIVCRCESVTAGALRGAASAHLGATEMNRLKALTRCGMGRCQARYCELAAREIFAATLGVSADAVGRVRGQAPVKPLPGSAYRSEGA